MQLLTAGLDNRVRNCQQQTTALMDGWISLLTSLPGHYHTPGAPGNTGPSTISIQTGEQETGKTDVSHPSVNQEQAGPH